MTLRWVILIETRGGCTLSQWNHEGVSFGKMKTWSRGKKKPKEKYAEMGGSLLIKETRRQPQHRGQSELKGRRPGVHDKLVMHMSMGDRAVRSGKLT